MEPNNLKRTFSLFFQAAPENIDVEGVQRKMLALQKVISCHHTHLWSLDGSHHVLTTHVVPECSVSRKDILGIKQSVRRMAKEREFVHIPIETEPAGEHCSMRDAV